MPLKVKVMELMQKKNYLCGPFVELFYTNGHNSTLLTNGS